MCVEQCNFGLYTITRRRAKSWGEYPVLLSTGERNRIQLDLMWEVRQVNTEKLIVCNVQQWLWNWEKEGFSESTLKENQQMRRMLLIFPRFLLGLPMRSISTTDYIGFVVGMAHKIHPQHPVWKWHLLRTGIVFYHCACGHFLSIYPEGNDLLPTWRWRRWLGTKRVVQPYHGTGPMHGSHMFPLPLFDSSPGGSGVGCLACEGTEFFSDTETNTIKPETWILYGIGRGGCLDVTAVAYSGLVQNINLIGSVAVLNMKRIIWSIACWNPKSGLHTSQAVLCMLVKTSLVLTEKWNSVRWCGQSAVTTLSILFGQIYKRFSGLPL